MKPKKVIAGLVLVIIVNSCQVMQVFAIPEYSFGGGVQAIHISENPVKQGQTAMSDTTNVEQANYQNGSLLGKLEIPRFSKTVKIYEGATLDSMAKGAGHFESTSLAAGNFGIIGHNRGSAGYFSFVKSLSDGDVVNLTIGDVAKKYTVVKSYTVADTDFEPLQQFGDNRLTLITCVENVPNKRRVVVCAEEN
jgi:LPXTG-site transpeptidase (sortase) family protein